MISHLALLSICLQYKAANSLISDTYHMADPIFNIRQRLHATKPTRCGAYCLIKKVLRTHRNFDNFTLCGSP